MKFSYNWITQYLNFELSIKHFCEILTNSGLEIKSCKEVFLNKILERVILGQITSLQPFPDNKSFIIILVDIGKEHVLQIICRYKNLYKGKKIMIAPIGEDILSEIGKKTKIELLIINGVFSYGIICISRNIGLEDSNILYIYNNKSLGSLGKDFFKVKKDYSFEIEVSPNRIDTMCHWGIAREIYILLKMRRFAILLYKPSIKNFQILGTLNKVLISINDIKTCKRYSGCIISGIKIAASELWMQNRLLCIGIQPYNNIVDIINFIMYEFGQSINVLDIDDLDGNEIHIKKLQQNCILYKKSNSKSKKEIKDFIICDAKKIIGIAGIYCSNIQESTKDVFIESSYFESVNIRKYVKRYGINTYSSFLSQRGIDHDNIIYALKRAAILFTEIAGGNIYSPIDIYPKYLPKYNTTIRYRQISSMIGKEISKKSIKKILSILDINILIKKKHELYVSIPSYRIDIFREVDIIEDILRIYGAQKIKIPRTFYFSKNISKRNTFQDFENEISLLLNAQGFYEVINLSISREEYIKYLNTNVLCSSTIKLINSFNKEISVMRESLLFGLLENISYNLKRKNLKLKFFEWGNIYEKIEKTYNEKYYLGLILSGKDFKDHWIYLNGTYSFFYFKGIIEGILKKYGINNFQQKIREDALLAHSLWLYYNNTPIARLGRIKNKIIKFFNVKQDVFYAEIYCIRFFNLIQYNFIHFEPISQLPGMFRDLAILFDKYISFEEIYQKIKSSREEIIKDIQLFDVYESNNLQKNTKSYALSFYLEFKNKNLSSIDIVKIMENLQKTLNHNLGIYLR